MGVEGIMVSFCICAALNAEEISHGQNNNSITKFSPASNRLGVINAINAGVSAFLVGHRQWDFDT